MRKRNEADNLMLSFEYIVQEYKYSEIFECRRCFGSHKHIKGQTVLGPWNYCLI